MSQSPEVKAPSETPGMLEWVGPVLVVGGGIAFNGLVGYLALTHRNDAVSLVKLMVMVVPAASVYVSSGDRGLLLVYVILFTLIAFLSSLGRNLGLAFAAFGIMAYAVLNVLRHRPWQRSP